MSIPSGLADYLQGAGYWTPLRDATAYARWGEKGAESALMSPIDAKVDADGEAARQLAFLKEPHVREKVLVLLTDIDALRGRCWTIRAAAPGYEGAGALCLVLGGVPDETNGLCTLEVLRRLA